MRFQGIGFRVSGVGFSVCRFIGFGFWFLGLESGVKGLRLRVGVSGYGFRIYGLGFRVSGYGLRFRVKG
jgi:hypothetical protein